MHDPALIEELGIGHARGGTLRLISSLFVDFPCPFGYARMYSWPYDGDSFEIPRTGINRKMPKKAMFGDLARGQSLLRPHRLADVFATEFVYSSAGSAPAPRSTGGLYDVGIRNAVI